MKKNKIQRRIENPISFFYPTSDDWSPNFARNTVQFRVYLYYNCIDDQKGMIRIVVSGADDTGMEKDESLPVADYDKRLAEIRSWLENMIPNPVSKNWLLQQGFKRW